MTRYPDDEMIRFAMFDRRIICAGRTHRKLAVSEMLSRGARDTKQNSAVLFARLGYSYRRASTGSRRDAVNAGYIPKKRPTDAEKPMPIANDHHGSEIGKPETRWRTEREFRRAAPPALSAPRFRAFAR